MVSQLTEAESSRVGLATCCPPLSLFCFFLLCISFFCRCVLNKFHVASGVEQGRRRRAPVHYGLEEKGVCGETLTISTNSHINMRWNRVSECNSCFFSTPDFFAWSYGESAPIFAGHGGLLPVVFLRAGRSPRECLRGRAPRNNTTQKTGRQKEKQDTANRNTD
jgi:hypothetical protein